MKKLLSLILCAVISAGTLCACDSDDAQSVPMEDMPYGSTMRQLVDTEIDVCFDSRFFSDDEMKAVSSYYYAIQTKDKDLFMTTQSEPYVKYVEKVADSDLKVEDYIESMYSDSAASLGEGFEYVYIEAVDYGDRTDDLEIDEITSLMDEVYEDSGKDVTFKETVNSAKYAVLDFTAENNGSQYTLNDQVVYIFDCTDGIFIYTAN